MSILMPVPHSLEDYSFTVSLKLGHVRPPNLFFFEDFLITLYPTQFHINFRVSLSLPEKKYEAEILIKIALNL